MGWFLTPTSSGILSFCTTFSMSAGVYNLTSMPDALAELQELGETNALSSQETFLLPSGKTLKKSTFQKVAGRSKFTRELNKTRGPPLTFV